MGIEVYATHSPGIGGVIRRSIEDFVVEEVLVDGSRAEVSPSENVRKRSTLGSSSTKDRYLLCVLVKRNWDTLLAIKAVADQLDISPSRIHIAGIKDAKAVTAQHVTIEGVYANEAENVQVRDIHVRSLGYFRHRLSSYYSLGNSFRIIIRSMSHSEPTIKKRIVQIAKEMKMLGGVPNFFGHQRFGTTRPITHLVGKEIVKGDLKKAAMLFLAKPSPNEHPDSRKAREQLQATKDFMKALQDFPKQLRYERLMLKHLAEKEDDYVGAFRKLPTKLRELFPQAYQAYVFNKLLSRRLAGGSGLNRVEIGDIAVKVERSGLPIVTMHSTTTAECVQKTNEAIKSGKMRLALPLIGFKQPLSQGVQRNIENQILQKEAISLEAFRIPMMPEARLRGELRVAATPLNDFTLGEVSHDHEDHSGIQVGISFMLHRGSYATVVLRELMKPRDPIGAGF
jgi:tRNA pseudouridine13 synthase